MIKDEYNRLPDEFSNTGEEFNQNYNGISFQKIKDKKKLTRRIKKSIQLFTCTVVTIATIDAYSPFTVFGKENVNKDLDNNQNEVMESSVDTNKDNVAKIEENTNEVEYIEIECDECNGTGIICDGDPDFGYDRGNGYGYKGCNGTGYSPCPDIRCNGGYVVCEECKGTNLPCESCNDTRIQICEFCHGTSIAECISIESHHTCQKCNGEKIIKVEKTQYEENLKKFF